MPFALTTSPPLPKYIRLAIKVRLLYNHFMNMVLFYDGEFDSGAVTISIKDARAAHIINVLHKNIGDTLTAGVVNKSAGEAVVTDITSSSLTLKYNERVAKKPFSNGEKCATSGAFNVKITLILGAVRPVQLRRLVRDVVALGVAQLFVVATQLTEKSYLAADVYKSDFMEHLLLDAAMQGATPYLPKYTIYKSLSQCLIKCHYKSTEDATYGDIVSSGADIGENGDNKSETSCDKILIALDNVEPTISLGGYLHNKLGNRFFKEDFTAAESGSSRCASYSDIVIAVGSERGWTGFERDLLRGASFTLASLGSRVMRTETAVTAALAVAENILGML